MPQEIYKNPAAAAEALEKAYSLEKKATPAEEAEKYMKYGGQKAEAEKPVLTDKARGFYTDEEIAKFSDQDIELINDFLNRFNNPKPRGK